MKRLSLDWKAGLEYGKYYLQRRKATLYFCLISLLVVLLIGAILGSAEDKYRKIKNTTDLIFDAEVAYQQKHGEFTAKLSKLGLENLELTQQQYEASHYVDDKENNAQFYTPEMAVFINKKGDSFSIDAYEKNLFISASSHDKRLRATYSLNYYLDSEFIETTEPVIHKSCIPTVQHSAEQQNKQEEDIKLGGNLCKAVGAVSTWNPFIWSFVE